MPRYVPRLPAVVVAAALSGLLLMLGGTASAAGPRSHSTSPTDARTSSERGLTGWKAALHKIDVGTRTHHEKSGVGPEPADLPAAVDAPGSDTREEPCGSPAAGVPSAAQHHVLGRAPPR